MQTNEDLINKQTFINGIRKLKKIPLNSEKGWFKSKYNPLIKQSSIATGSHKLSVYNNTSIVHRIKNPLRRTSEGLVPTEDMQISTSEVAILT